MSEQQVWTDDEFVSELSEHSAAHKNDWNAALELGRKMLKAWQADHDDLTAQLTDMTNSQHVNERSLDEYARTIARLRQELADIKRNGYIPAREPLWPDKRIDDAIGDIEIELDRGEYMPWRVEPLLQKMRDEYEAERRATQQPAPTASEGMVTLHKNELNRRIANAFDMGVEVNRQRINEVREQLGIKPLPPTAKRA